MTTCGRRIVFQLDAYESDQTSHLTRKVLRGPDSGVSAQPCIYFAYSSACFQHYGPGRDMIPYLGPSYGAH